MAFGERDAVQSSAKINYYLLDFEREFFLAPFPVVYFLLPSFGEIANVTEPSLLNGYNHSSLKIRKKINSWIGQGARAKPKIEQKMAEPTARRRGIS